MRRCWRASRRRRSRGARGDAGSWRCWRWVGRRRDRTARLRADHAEPGNGAASVQPGRRARRSVGAAGASVRLRRRQQPRSGAVAPRSRGRRPEHRLHLPLGCAGLAVRHRPGARRGHRSWPARRHAFRLQRRRQLPDVPGAGAGERDDALHDAGRPGLAAGGWVLRWDGRRPRERGPLRPRLRQPSRAALPLAVHHRHGRRRRLGPGRLRRQCLQPRTRRRRAGRREPVLPQPLQRRVRGRRRARPGREPVGHRQREQPGPALSERRRDRAPGPRRRPRPRPAGLHVVDTRQRARPDVRAGSRTGRCERDRLRRRLAEWPHPHLRAAAHPGNAGDRDARQRLPYPDRPRVRPWHGRPMGERPAQQPAAAVRQRAGEQGAAQGRAGRQRVLRRRLPRRRRQFLLRGRQRVRLVHVHVRSRWVDRRRRRRRRTRVWVERLSGRVALPGAVAGPDWGVSRTPRTRACSRPSSSASTTRSASPASIPDAASRSRRTR